MEPIKILPACLRLFNYWGRKSTKFEIQLAITMFRPLSYSVTNSSTSSLTLSDSETPVGLITELELVREFDESPHHIYAHTFEYLRPFLDPFVIDDWLFYEIYKQGSSDVLLTYAINILEQTYHILDVQLLYPNGTRKTEIRLHEIIKSTWAKDVESTDVELKRIGFYHLKDVAARKALFNEFTHALSQGMDPMSTQVTVSGNGELPLYWRENPFLMAACGVFGGSKNVTAHLIREQQLDLDIPMHLVVELSADRKEEETVQPTRDADVLSRRSEDGYEGDISEGDSWNLA